MIANVESLEDVNTISLNEGTIASFLFLNYNLIIRKIINRVKYVYTNGFIAIV